MNKNKTIEELLSTLQNSYRINREIIVAKKEVKIAKIERDKLLKEFKIKEEQSLKKLDKELTRFNKIINDREKNVINSLTFYDDDKIKEIRNKIINLKMKK